MNKKILPEDVAAMIAQAEALANGVQPAPFAGAAGQHAPFAPDMDGASAEDLLLECAAEPMTDIGNARRLLLRYGKKVLHVARVGWHGFDGMHWKEDEDGSVVRPLAQKTAELIDNEALLMTATEDEEKIILAAREARRELHRMGRPKNDWEPEKLGRFMELTDQVEAGEEARKKVNGRKSARHTFAKSSAGTSKINNMLTEAAPHVARMVDTMNTDLFAFNCKNGTLRFGASGGRNMVDIRLDPHNPDDYISKLAGVAWEPEAEAPEFEKFLMTVQPDADIRTFLQRFFGYCLTGLTREQILVFFYGAGRNGKSTFVDLLCEVMANYAVTLSIDSFAGDQRRGGNEATPDLARLPGARLVAASEPEMGVKLKDALIKTLTGGEKIPVRRLHQDFIEVIPQFKIVLSGNHKPRIDDNSDGIWRRVNLVPWDIQIPEAEVDRQLPKKLRKEMPGVFKWMVMGALDYLNYGLAIPDKVRMATAEYREDSDPIGAFIRAACVVTAKDEDCATPDDLFIGYTNWASREGQAEFKKVTLLRRFPAYAAKAWADADGKMVRFWKAKTSTTVYRGLRVRSEFMTAPGQQGHGSAPPYSSEPPEGAPF